MALTRANVEAILIRRVGKRMTQAALDGTTNTGANADLNDPIGWAVRKAGYTVDDISAVDNDDVARISTADIDKFLDLAEYRALQSILGNSTDVDTRVWTHGHEEKLSDLAEQLEKLIARKEKQIARDHGIGLGTLTAGKLSLGFQQQETTTATEL